MVFWELSYELWWGKNKTERKKAEEQDSGGAHLTTHSKELILFYLVICKIIIIPEQRLCGGSVQKNHSQHLKWEDLSEEISSTFYAKKKHEGGDCRNPPCHTPYPANRQRSGFHYSVMFILNLLRCLFWRSHVCCDITTKFCESWGKAIECFNCHSKMHYRQTLLVWS